MKSKLFSQCIVESVDKSKSKGEFSVIYGAKKSRNNIWHSKKAKTIKEFVTAFSYRYFYNIRNRRSIAVPSKYEKNIKMTKWQGKKILQYLWAAISTKFSPVSLLLNLLSYEKVELTQYFVLINYRHEQSPV